ncbi:glycosyltransferase family 2 protein [Sharpea azabuensis]|uniref:glycosyltransferase family 2 protein n=1 Tax=Sharpea azabuensis TaxID=322505 RepID=UPI00156C5394|nr:glycosyltransferase family 2 protein [Sharpea azabuensis]
MNMTVKVSLIMPAYNIESEIKRSIESVLKQTYSNIELIIVDDGSKDSTPSIIDQYAKYHANIIPIHRENGGVFSARIEGMLQSTGDYIGFIDGDDDIEPEMIEQLLKNAIEYSADISHCGYKMIFPSGKVDLYYGTGNRVIQDNEKGVIDLLEGKYIEPGLWNKLYRRELFEKVRLNELDYSIKINEDLLLNYYLFKESKRAIYVDQCYYHYILRLNSAATSTINKNKLSDPLKVLRIMLEDNTQEDIYYDLILVRLARQLITLSTMSCRPNPKLIRPYKRQAQQELRSRLISILKCKGCSIKVKIMAVWAAILPITYQTIHFLYERLTGLDKKYSLE